MTKREFGMSVNHHTVDDVTGEGEENTGLARPVALCLGFDTAALHLRNETIESL